MSEALVVLHPREIPVCMAAFAELDIPKLWLTGWTEAQIRDTVFPGLLRDHPYDRYLVVADDVIVRQATIDRVVTALEIGWPVATGFSQRSHSEWEVNLTSSPIGDRPVAAAYDFLAFQDVVSHPEPLFQTWFAGMSVTGMSRTMWERFPFGCYSDAGSPNGYASDFHLSHRLQDAEIPIMACRDGFAYHWRHEWRHTNDERDDKLLIGEVKPAVTLT